MRLSAKTRYAIRMIFELSEAELPFPVFYIAPGKFINKYG